MKKSEAYKLIALALAAHPNYQEKDMEPTVQAWYVLLKDLPYDLAEAALTAVLKTSPFFPTVAAVRNMVLQMGSAQMTPELAWQEVLTQVRKVGYLGKPMWSHEAVGRAAEALYGNWTQLCANLRHDNEHVDRAHFYRIYQSITEPERLRQQIGGENVRLLEGKSNETPGLGGNQL